MPLRRLAVRQRCISLPDRFKAFSVQGRASVVGVRRVPLPHAERLYSGGRQAAAIADQPPAARGCDGQLSAAERAPRGCRAPPLNRRRSRSASATGPRLDASRLPDAAAAFARLSRSTSLRPALELIGVL